MMTTADTTEIELSRDDESRIAEPVTEPEPAEAAVTKRIGRPHRSHGVHGHTWLVTVTGYPFDRACSDPPRRRRRVLPLEPSCTATIGWLNECTVQSQQRCRSQRATDGGER